MDPDNNGGLFAISKKSLKNSHFEPPAQKAVFTKKSLKKTRVSPVFLSDFFAFFSILSIYR